MFCVSEPLGHHIPFCFKMCSSFRQLIDSEMVSTARPADQLMRATVALGLLIEGRLVSKGWSLGQ